MPRQIQGSRSSTRIASPRKTTFERANRGSRSMRRIAAPSVHGATSIQEVRGHRVRFWVSLLLTTYLAPPAIAATAAEPDIAIRVEGYLGYSNLDVIERIDAFQGGGSGSVSLIFDRIYVQGDVFGDVMDFEGNVEGKNVGPGLHLGWRDPDRGSAGVVGTYNNVDLGIKTLDVYRAGFEGEVYLDRLTIGLNGGYFDLDDSGFGYLDGLFAFYPTERARLSLRIGAIGIEQSNPLINLGGRGEYLVTDALAPFVRWEGSVSDTFGQVLQHSIVVGLTFYWGGDTPSLQAYDRSYFNQSCGGVLLVSRLC